MPKEYGMPNTRSCFALGLHFYGQDLLYKFFVRSRADVPAGIHEANRQSEKALDQRRANEAKEEGRGRDGMVGRIRPSRVDTGNPVYQNEANVQIGSIRSLLALRGYRVADCHWYRQQNGQHVIVLSLKQGGDSVTLAPETIEGLRKLARESTWKVNIWDNYQNRPSTLNFTDRKEGGNPQRMLVIRDGFLKLTDLDATDPYEMERAEDERMSDEISGLLEGIRL